MNMKKFKRILSVVLVLSVLMSQGYIITDMENVSAQDPASDTYDSDGYLKFTGYNEKRIMNKITWVEFDKLIEKDSGKTLGDSDFTENEAYNGGQQDMHRKKLKPAVLGKTFTTGNQYSPYVIEITFKNFLVYDPNDANDTSGRYRLDNSAGNAEIATQDHKYSNLYNNCGIKKEGYITFANTTSGQKMGIAFNVKTKYGNKYIPASVILASGEEANTNELEMYTTDGTPWELIAEMSGNLTTASYIPITDKLKGYDENRVILNEVSDKSQSRYICEGNAGKFYGDGIGTYKFGPVVTGQNATIENGGAAKGFSVPIVMSKSKAGKEAEGVNTAIYIHSGRQATLFGVILFDSSDAEKTYGSPKHLVNTNKTIQQQPFLGKIKADFDYTEGHDWEEDDLKGALKDDGSVEGAVDKRDEGIEQLLVASADNGADGGRIGNKAPAYVYGKDTYKLKMYASAAKLAGGTTVNGAKEDSDTIVNAFVDFNKDGRFNNDIDDDIDIAHFERAKQDVIVTGDGEEITCLFEDIKFTKDIDELAEHLDNYAYGYNIGARARIAIKEEGKTIMATHSAVNTAFSGEVEDFLVPVQLPPKGDVHVIPAKPVLAGQDPEPSYVDVNFKAYGKVGNTNEANKIDTDADLEVYDKAGNKLTPNAEGKYTVTGEGTYELVDENGTRVTTATATANGAKVRIKFTPDPSFNSDTPVKGISIRAKDKNENDTNWKYDAVVDNNVDGTKPRMDAYVKPEVGVIITEQYLDEDGNKIAPDKQTVVSKGDAYDLDGELPDTLNAGVGEKEEYKHKDPADLANPADDVHSGTANNNVIVKHYYEKGKKVTVKYVANYQMPDGTAVNNEEVRADKILSKIYFKGDNYGNDIDNEGVDESKYDFVDQNLSNAGVMQTEDVTVVRKYTRPLHNLIIKHRYDGSDVLPEKTIKLLKGDTYDASTTLSDDDKETLKNGNYVKNNPANESGTMGDNDITVTYEYTKSPTVVTIKYLDEDGNTIKPSVQEGLSNTKPRLNVQDTKADISGYDYVRTEGASLSDTINKGDANKEITHVYRKKPNTGGGGSTGGGSGSGGSSGGGSSSGGDSSSGGSSGGGAIIPATYTKSTTEAGGEATTKAGETTKTGESTSKSSESTAKSSVESTSVETTTAPSKAAVETTATAAGVSGISPSLVAVTTAPAKSDKNIKREITKGATELVGKVTGTSPFISTQPKYGKVTISDDGTYVYIPDDPMAMAYDSFVITVINVDGIVEDVLIEIVPKGLPDTGSIFALELYMAIGVALLALGLLVVSGRKRKKS